MEEREREDEHRPKAVVVRQRPAGMTAVHAGRTLHRPSMLHSHHRCLQVWCWGCVRRTAGIPPLPGLLPGVCDPFWFQGGGH